MRFPFNAQTMRRSGAMWTATLLAALLAACATIPPPKPAVVTPPVVQPPAVTAPAPTPVLEPVGFDTLPGWNDDDLTAAWPAFLASCRALRFRPDWRVACDSAPTIAGNDVAAMRNFFETRFTANRLLGSDGVDSGLVTGYYEPLLRGSRVPLKPYLTPLYGVPDDLLTIDLGDLYPELKNLRLRGKLQGKKVVPYPSRGDIESAGLLKGKELVWVDDPVEAFFLQVQGSGRVQLVDGAKRNAEVIRLAYADQNGHPYKSIGRWLVDRGEMQLSDASMQGIQAWAAAHPQRLNELLDVNPSYVFFREVQVSDPNLGPTGAFGVPLTPGRSIAVDARAVPLGAPVFLATTEPNTSTPLRRLMLAQDTGGAIRGIVRADFFWGFGAAAGAQAGRMKQQGKMWVLLPKTAPR